MNLYDFEILRRTFEGVDDSRLNNDILTSEHSPSKKWLLRYKRRGYDYNIDEVFETKKLAQQRKENLTK